MRDFNKVSPTLWQSSRFVDLPSDDGRLLSRISHREGRIGPENLVKLFCNKHLADSERGSDANTVYLQSA